MFARKTVGGEALAPETPGEQPGKSPASQRPPAHESRVFQPSTFAQRRTDRAREGTAVRGPRLVFEGTSEFRQENMRTRQTEVVTVELFYELEHPMRRFYRIPPNGPLQPLFDDQRRDEVVPLGTVRTSGFEPQTYHAAPPDPPPVPVR